MTYLRLLILAWAAMVLLLGRAHAGTVERALAIACPGHADLAPIVEREARTHLLHPVRLVVVIACESQCDSEAVNGRTMASGLGQIIPGLSADMTGRDLFDPGDSLYLTARHLSRWLTKCGSLGGAVHVYHGHKKCSGWKRDWYARRVLAREAWIWREMRKRKEPTT